MLIGPSAGERVVVGARYDAFEASPRADDNASGVAALRELARALAANPPRTTVELVACTLEAPPHFATRYVGSAVHAHVLKSEGSAGAGDAVARDAGQLQPETLDYVRMSQAAAAIYAAVAAIARED